MKRSLILTAIVLAAFLAACTDAVDPDQVEDVVVLTRNVYVGTDVDQILLAETPEQLLVRVEAAWQQLVATDFAERAEALADEIMDAEPHLVGLQEITTFRTSEGTPERSRIVTGLPSTGKRKMRDMMAAMLSRTAMPWNMKAKRLSDCSAFNRSLRRR